MGITKEEVTTILSDNPTLGYFGFNNGSMSWMDQIPATETEWNHELTFIDKCLTWIGEQTQTTEVVTTKSTLDLGPTMFQVAGAGVTVGHFIVAAIHAGLQWQLADDKQHIHINLEY